MTNVRKTPSEAGETHLRGENPQPTDDSGSRPRASRFSRVKLGARRLGWSCTVVPLFPAGRVVVWQLDLWSVRYQWGEVK